MTTATRLGRSERRQSILDGATAAFAERGYSATSMSAIADAAGITPLIIYRHFDSKEELYRAALQSVRDELIASGALRPSSRGTGLDVGVALVAARRDPAGFRLLWRHASREPDFSATPNEVRDLAVASLRDALAERVPEADLLDWAARAAVAYVVEAILIWLEHGRPERDADFVKATEAALRAGVRTWSTG